MTTSRIYSKQIEKSIAVFNLFLVLVVIIWKTIGLHWLPFGFEQALKDVLDEESGAYPRHGRNEAEYNLFYLVLYGIFGLLAQLGSLRLVYNPQDKLAKGIFGLFHVAISVYHVLFSSRIIEGKLLILDKGAYRSHAVYGAVALYTFELLLSLDFFFGKMRGSYDMTRKTSLDLTSSLNLMPLGIYMLLYRFSIRRKDLENVINMSFFVMGPLILYVMEFCRIITSYTKSKEKKSASSKIE